MAYVDTFYHALGKSPSEFEKEIDRDFVAKMAKWRVRGGASTTLRKEAIQEAVDALEVYGRVCFADGQVKKDIFRSVYHRHHQSKRLPDPSNNVWKAEVHMKKIEAHYNILMAKFCLLDYWCAVAKNYVKPDYQGTDAHWATHEFLNFEPKKVRPILELMVYDMEEIRKKPYSASLDKWRGYKAESSMKRTKTEMADVINAEATLNASVGVRGTFEMEYKGFKLNADTKLVAGANAQASGEVCITPTMLTANASVGVDVTLRMSGNMNVDVLDILQLEAGIEGIAGALAEAGLELEVSATGAKLALSAEAFAGVKITGTAQGTFKLDGRAVATATAKASAMAGVGASAAFSCECSLFGKMSFGAEAGAAFGVGVSTGAKFSVDPHNIKWAATNIFYVYLNKNGFNKQGKVWLLPLEENYEMAEKCRDTLYQMLGELYNENENEIGHLEAWERLKKRVAIAMRQRYPKFRNLEDQQLAW